MHIDLCLFIARILSRLHRTLRYYSNQILPNVPKQEQKISLMNCGIFYIFTGEI